MTKKKKKLSVRQKAARRTAAGGFNKAVFKEVGGQECPNCAKLTASAVWLPLPLL